MLLWRDTGGLSDFLDFLAMLISAGAEEDVVALHPFHPGDGVSQHNLVGVADMRLPRGVGNGGGDVECFLVHKHRSFLDGGGVPTISLNFFHVFSGKRLSVLLLKCRNRASRR